MSAFLLAASDASANGGMGEITWPGAVVIVAAIIGFVFFFKYLFHS